MPRTVKLTKPLVTHKGETMELTLRDITASDMVEMRVSPFQFINLGDNTKTDVANKRVDQRFDIRYDIVSGYLSRLTGIDAILLGTMAGRDMLKVTAVFTEMWNDDAGESTVASEPSSSAA